MKKVIYQVNAFSDLPFGGNPAGVVPNAIGLNYTDMLNIAREMNLSETAFVFPMKDEEADYEVRFFTPTQEVDLCGHATIGSFFSLASKGIITGTDNVKIVKQKTKAGILPVELYFKDNKIDSVMMTQAKPKFVFDVANTYELAQIMGINARDIGISGYSLIPQAVSTGLTDIMLPVKSLSALKSLNPNYTRLTEYSNNLNIIGVHAFTLETEEDSSTLSCRNFGPAAGINEESATGTSNGALGAYLVKNDVLKFEDNITIICEQGYYMNRPSKIIVRLEGSKENLTVKVGGKSVIVMEGLI
ncbi:PhzF family phenazine biosynthesis protein [Clostridium sp. CM028]|uniref:PhzF family phenazine biosynthesis protein n=1 Tax=unclassified Clostridium TaxID=2614128 RepID=UPI001C0B3284|nr:MULTISPECIES: PhzF family phenazine biosynthesis protein [unclassified Clostridium]MBU3093057.1 PhzF family phenazine biosynthesis protein [Clostridium sp. CF011]MBW9145037.1 PhzF family phenazine biosynthesis protein [Clostridium sp. CM027]MBW9148553.1 PhzF family phenazine biosynthesis protein [Clostridium sp. CM028]UVE40168.1 PhzF family phenazine biosynthesis protein [Clostridium sp. CM027]WAG69112.1 PhzF family phenazine biosynthesis protein [Clostridium sp. CF011]